MESASEYTQRLIKHGARAHKSLGQVFLISDEVIDCIISASTLQPDVPLVEIGPGLGVLTRVLAPKVPKMWAVELDSHKIGILNRELKGLPIEIVNQDALKLDLKDLWGDQLGYLVGNLPYYITSPLIMHFLEQADRLSGMTIMIQKEVADRIAAPPGSKTYGILSIAVQISASVTKVTDVLPSAFWPSPKVTSSVLRLDLRPYPGFDVNKKDFFRIVKAAFSQRRKTLSNSLMGGLGIKKEEVIERLQSVGISEGRRAESLSIEEFQILTRSFQD
ncbi:16S rRNA (adenine(1518)-N(6)/adenine(1519)-N(6))-dimethyltransferase RsmA [Desulfosporosinus sp. BICA1-9]|uniref:16S rRNA (adenine(1518)-N(6)/adenine(1519)-N(6))- dimethyltransferase RsmA n=1 Tax=Desulfosporosinus sp. BICA1-9 TaxID=1531958 RepID=UPI00054C1FC3|nr:16S rRNA (adenine(1518)-N(6)/adenine(1519)-N(6))-dimethyltransferase RsmA [Desulfosporosinus sp. BICA1-9]KJS46352.1 MAG: 16S rRNA methyltransferase [Peptococcaceae bacterium BRH_c23]KJS89614.1 MAG: 16S rRNA methyltransferase [Desulfosporosinus sp. BICA1-9]HBW39153.1 ribosomal RNA small subunit methyltransferase A [Desulfosporosinus sp.]